jgi:hypothetical protein
LRIGALPPSAAAQAAAFPAGSPSSTVRLLHPRRISVPSAKADLLSDPRTPPEADQPATHPRLGSARAAIHPDLGVVALSGPAIRHITAKLRERMDKDPRLKARFQEDPRGVLASVGLNDEIQVEILRVDQDFSGSPFLLGRLEDWCICTGCCCTSCCCTCCLTAFSR